MAFPVAAAAIMAGASLLGNALNSAAEQESKENGRAYLSGAQSRANSDYLSIINQINDYYNNNRIGAMGTSQDVSDYANAIRGYNADDYVFMPGQFEWDKDRKDYVTPYYDQIINDTASKVQQTAAGAGISRGSGAAADTGDDFETGLPLFDELLNDLRRLLQIGTHPHHGISGSIEQSIEW